MYFDLTALECFIAVTETRSFTRAANKVGRTQSAVSQQIAKLEGQIGKTLFIRKKNFLLTLEGEKLLSYAEKIIGLSHEAIDFFKQPELKGEVRFGLPEDFANLFLSDILTAYASIHPRIQLNVECDLTLNLFHRFKENAFDLVLVKMNKPEDFPNGIEVWSEQLVWVGDRKFFLNGFKDPIPLVLSPRPCVYRSRAIEALESNNLPWRLVFSSRSFAANLAAVKAGMGVSVLSKNMVPRDLKIISQESNIPSLDDTHISLLKHHAKNIAVNSFEKFVIERLRH